MAITSTVPNIFVNGAGNVMESTEVIANFDHIISDVNNNATALSEPIIGALPFRNLTEGEITDANKIMANFQFIRGQVNSRAVAAATPIVNEFPNIIKNKTLNDADDVNENFQHLVDQINDNASGTTENFVVTGGNGVLLASSANGLEWNDRTMPSNSNWVFSDWNGSRFSAISFNSPAAAYSDNGKDWVSATLPITRLWTAMGWNGSYFLVVSSIPTSSWMKSTDGINWTFGSMPVTTNFRGLAWNGSLWVTMDQNDGKRCYTSPDGENWTERTVPGLSDIQYRQVAWNGSTFVAVGGDGGAFGIDDVVTSPDGINWTFRVNVLPKSGQWNNFVWNESVFMAVEQGDRIAVSVDGVSWSSKFAPTGEAWGAIGWDGNVVCLVSNLGGPIYTSDDDGDTWSVGTTIPSYDRTDIATSYLTFTTY